jgi:hypothetical protein
MNPVAIAGPHNFGWAVLVAGNVSVPNKYLTNDHACGSLDRVPGILLWVGAGADYTTLVEENCVTNAKRGRTSFWHTSTVCAIIHVVKCSVDVTRAQR